MRDNDWMSEKAVSDIARTRDLSEPEKEYLYSIAHQMCEAGHGRFAYADLKLLCEVAESYPSGVEVLKVVDEVIGESFDRGYKNNFVNWVVQEKVIKNRVSRNIGGLRGRLTDHLLGEFSGNGMAGVREGRAPLSADIVYIGGLPND